MRKLIGLMFAVMVFMLPRMAVKAETVNVGYENAIMGTDNTVTFETKNAVCTIVENNDSGNNVVWESGWYAVTRDIEINDRIIINGEVNLILCDGAKLTAKKGITVSPGNTLNIHGQSGGTGKLYAVTTDGTGLTAQENYAGIGGELEGCGTITINGGNVTANGNGAGIGIGGDRNGGTGGNITINGGTVTVKGGNSSAGIGGGNNGSGGTIAINGGIVKAIGGNQAAGIGGGNNGSGGTITINGGIVTANGGIDAQGIGNGANYSGNGTNTLTLGSGVNLYTLVDSSWNGPISETGNISNEYRKRFMKVLPLFRT